MIFISKLISVLSLALLAAGAQITTTEPSPSLALLDREILFGNPERTQGRISPDGTMLSWLAPDDYGVLNVWVAPLDGDDADIDIDSGAKVITDSKERTPSGYFWTADSKYILYTLDKEGDENTHVYAANVQTSENRDLTPVSEGVKAGVFSYSYRQPETLVVGMNDRNPLVFDLYTVDITTGDSALLIENPGNYAGWLLDQNNVVRGSLAVALDGSGILYKRANNNDGKFEVFQTISSEDLITTYDLQFGGDDETFYILDSRGRDKVALAAVNFTTGDTTIVAESDKADVSHVEFDLATNEPLAYLVNYLKPEWTALDTDYEEVLDAVETMFGNDTFIISSTTDRSKVVVVTDSPIIPLTYYLFDRSTGEFSELFVARPNLDASLLQPMQAFEVESRDGLMLTTYLTLPGMSDTDGDGKPEEPLPMALLVHGGPWARDYYSFNPWHQLLANRGYVAMSVNYRGSTGFGKNFTNAAVREFAGKMHTDLLDAVDYAVGNGIADPSKVAIMGGSYGGYATLVGLTFTPDTFACGVDIVGMSSLVTLVESFPAYWIPVLGIWYKFVGNPANETERADMLARSPITRIDAIKSPLLIGQGENDPRVTKQESDNMVEEMSKRGQIVTYINYPDEGHGFGRPENVLSFAAVADNFLSQCLGGQAQDYGNDFEGSSIEVVYGAEYVPGLAEELEKVELSNPPSDSVTETPSENPETEPSKEPSLQPSASSNSIGAQLSQSARFVIFLSMGAASVIYLSDKIVYPF